MVGLLLIVCLVAAPAMASREVAITFDDLVDLDASDHSTAQIERLNRKLVAALARDHVPVTGFVNEEKLLDDAGLLDPRRLAVLRLWLDAGLDLGNHTFSHADLDAVSIQQYEDEIVRGEAILRPLVTERGRPLRWFRQPYLNSGTTLARRDEIAAFLANHGYSVAPVTIDDSEWIFDVAYDKAMTGPHLLTRFRLRRAYLRYLEARFGWAEYESRLVLEREIPQVLLLHASQLNADCANAVLRLIRRRGYSIVPLDVAVNDRAYQSRDEWTGGGVGWIERWGVTAGIPQSRFEGDPPVPQWVQKYAGTSDR